MLPAQKPDDGPATTRKGRSAACDAEGRKFSEGELAGRGEYRSEVDRGQVQKKKMSPGLNDNITSEVVLVAKGKPKPKGGPAEGKGESGKERLARCVLGRLKGREKTECLKPGVQEQERRPEYSDGREEDWEWTAVCV